ncbi:MAG: hypothetical protein FJ004_07830 [Chloroflexi bacterium]|nr:hypothetical protein [Chloroflexota bacterium]
MALLLSGMMAVLQSFANHFVTSDQYFEMMSDGQWVLHGTVTPSAKANLVAGALADVVLYGSQTIAQIMQVMVAPSVP